MTARDFVKVRTALVDFFDPMTSDAERADRLIEQGLVDLTALRRLAKLPLLPSDVGPEVEVRPRKRYSLGTLSRQWSGSGWCGLGGNACTRSHDWSTPHEARNGIRYVIEPEVAS